MLQAGHRRVLLAHARRCLEAAAHDRPVPAGVELPTSDDGAAMFVTLRKGSDLRGCIGDASFTKSLGDLVGAMTMAAATADPRFPRITPEEIDLITIEISHLTRPRPARIDEIDLGRHGIIVDNGTRRGLLLPQVAEEIQCSRAEFVKMACEKAGFRQTAHIGRDYTLKIFEAEVFQE